MSSDDHEHPWADAALAAEYATGRREETERAAKAHIAVRLARMSLGTVVLLIGVVAMIGPGPGLLIVAAGLGILARDVAWADRLLQTVRRSIPTNGDGRIDHATMATMVVVGLAITSASAWWMFFR